MTEIIIVVSDQKNRKTQKCTKILNIQQVFEANQINYSRINHESLHFLIPFSELKVFQKLSAFCNFLLIGKLTFPNHILIISVAVCNESGMQLKATSLHQKTFLIKYAMSLNKKSQNVQLKVNPITGQIRLQYSLIVSQWSDLDYSVYEALNTFKNNPALIYKILSCLQQQNINVQTNQIFQPLYEKFECLRSIIVNSSTCQLKSGTSNQKEHKNIFFESKAQAPISLKCINSSIIQKMRKSYVEEFKDRFVYNSAKIRLQNFTYLTFVKNPTLEMLKKKIQTNDVFLDDKIYQKFNLEGQKRLIQCEITPLSSQIINYQYSIVDKVSKKKLFLPFIKQYIIARNYLQLSNSYIMTKRIQQRQSLFKYLQRNKRSMSFETKLKIISQILTIAVICLQRVENYQPNLSVNNILINRNFSFKLDSLYQNDIKFENNLLQIMYKLFLQKTYYVNKERETYKNQFVSIQNSFMKYKGPSIIIKIMLKLMQNYEKQVEKQSKNMGNLLENILLFVNRIIDNYQKIQSGLEEDAWNCRWK